ncbi:E3 ubiquitin-protein ligase ZNRF3 [Fusarium oxysporum f. sp. cubense]|uniref:E3 ubiquitin-protein ligase ZNRF3 n=1 Tax=Fusarium oxysporum f. sp. cubense TaxID=61366 RepID=A0A559L232_FUSOC|nr:E3 ubiquitin-protein ligase ZNRF3 [Fusarium oxysporum f. sp. cubense]
MNPWSTKYAWKDGSETESYDDRASSVHLPWFLFGGTLAIVTIIIILLKFRSCNTRRQPRMTVIRVPPRQRTPIERHNLQTLNRANPSIKYKDVRKQSSVSSTEVSLAEICAVCLETLVDEEDVRRLTCEHVFHTRCLDSWFKEHHVDCPLCKCIFIPN